jgi:sporulation protein YlmC with PRC-barrel domain
MDLVAERSTAREDQMTTETTTAAGQTGEAEALILNNIGKGAPVYRPNGDRIGRIEGVMVAEATRKIVYAVVSFGGQVSLGANHSRIPWSLLVYSPQFEGYELRIADTPLGA